jgi:hypothetical protein
MSASSSPESTSSLESPPIDPAPQAPPWPFAKRFALCSAFVFLVFVNWPFPFSFISYTSELVSGPVEKMWNVLVPYVARAVFHVSANVRPNGSGDTTYNYVQAAIWVVAAIVIGGIWAALMRKRAKSDRTYEIFRIYLRFALAASMMGYGAAKVIQLQFPRPWLSRLVQPFGTASPMGILWTFMGVSRAYNFIAGAAEVLAGVLLTMRRTTLLGALLAMVVIGNIVALNFCYDVPVKLYSSELLLMAILITLPDAQRLIDLFLRTRQQPLFRRKWLETASLVVRTMLVAAFLAYLLKDANDSRKVYGDLASQSPLRGIWNVDELAEGGAVRPPLLTDTTRWRRVIFDSPLFASILLMNDARERYTIVLDEKVRKVTWTGRDDPKRKFTLAYSRIDPNTIVLDGIIAGQTVHAVCHRMGATGDLLLTRGFHWVNEYPFNR